MDTILESVKFAGCVCYHKNVCANLLKNKITIAYIVISIKIFYKIHPKSGLTACVLVQALKHGILWHFKALKFYTKHCFHAYNNGIVKGIYR